MNSHIKNRKSDFKCCLHNCRRSVSNTRQNSAYSLTELEWLGDKATSTHSEPHSEELLNHYLESE